MRNLIVGDTHSSFDRLMNVLDKAGFDRNNDNLYSTGDLCDRGEKPVETLKFLMELPHFSPVAGNHDLWLYDALRSNNPDDWWIDNNGGWITWERIIDDNAGKNFYEKVRDWLGKIPLIRILPKHIIVHGGLGDIANEKLLDEYKDLTIESTWRPQDRFGGINMDPRAEILVWDREYIYQALGAREKHKKPILPFDTEKTIVCGHTPLKCVFRSEKYHLICLDTGSFVKDGHLTLMDLDTGEMWQNDDNIGA